MTKENVELTNRIIEQIKKLISISNHQKAINRFKRSLKDWGKLKEELKNENIWNEKKQKELNKVLRSHLEFLERCYVFCTVYKDCLAIRERQK